MNKKLYILIAIFVVITIVFGTYLLVFQRKNKLPNKIEIQTKTGLLPVNNPRANSAATLSPNDVVIKENPDYQILFFEYGQEKSFLISITGENLSASREKAEADFLSSLDITKEQACKLNVSLSVSKDIDYSLAGQEFGLSFCPNGKPFFK